MAMQQLSGLDATFLHLETPEMPMHVGALHLIELPAGFKGHFVTALRKHIAARLPAAPVLRRKLWLMPLNLANPAWVDADPDLGKHIVEVRLPKEARAGDTMAAVQAEVARLHTVLLDRKRPLWKMHVIEGLAPGANGLRRVALYTQLHHAAVDGQAAVALANAILDTSPQPRAIEEKGLSRREKVYGLEMTEMLRGALGNQFSQIVGIVKELPSTLGTITGAARTMLGNSGLLGGKKGPSNLTLAPKTPYNASVTDRRTFAAVTLPLRELKLLGKAHEATLNDMVLMVVSGALRRHLGKKKILPRKSLVAAVPVSLREPGDTTSDNQASMTLVSLGTNLADPRKRLAHIKAASKAMKTTLGSVKSILPTDFPSLGVPWLMEAAAAVVGKARVADRIPQVANVVVSNVPGPPVPLYLAGARMLTNYPTSIVVHGMALNITVQSYDHSLDFGLMADAAAEPDIRDLARAIEAAYDDLYALPLPGEPEEEATIDEVVTRAARSITGSISDTLGGVIDKTVAATVDATVGNPVSKAVSKAVSQAVGKAVRGSVGTRVGRGLPQVAQDLVDAAIGGVSQVAEQVTSPLTGKRKAPASRKRRAR
jgi:WS/DGAT/MGAT family acyltransferase